MGKQQRIFLCKGEQVAIIKSNTHTYNVRAVKSGIISEVYKSLVISWFPDTKTKRPVAPKKKNINPQTNLEL